MIKTAIVLIFLLLSSVQVLKAQEDADTATGSEAIIEKGMEMHNNGNYQDAVNEYALVSPCDPNYARACYEMALSYYYLDEKQEALKKCHEAEFLHWSDPALYGLIGSILDDTDSTGAGMTVLKNALKKWPYSQKLLYNLAVCYLKINRPDLAEPILIKSIHYNPYHASSHIALARANYMMGRLAQSYLAFNMAILLNPSISYIQSFESAVTGTADTLFQPYDYPYPAGTDHKKWDRLRWYMQSEIAFNNKFDYNYKANYLIGRESLLLFREMKFDKSDTSFYNQMYVRFFSEMMKQGHFETFLNYQFKNVHNEEINNWLKKNQSKYKSFVSWAQNIINHWRAYGFSTVNEQNNITLYHFDDDGDLTSIGRQSADDAKIKNGWWTIINTDGSIAQRGRYTGNKLTGKWLVYYPDGAVKQFLVYKDDKLDSTATVYYPNGAIKALYPFKGDKKTGIEKHYSSSGQVIATYTYHNDTLDGPAKYTNDDKGFLEIYMYVHDTINGPYIEVWLNGNPKTKCTYKMGKFDGTYKTWYKNGRPEFEGYYTNGVQTGKSVNYFPNGRKSSVAEFDTAGKLVNKYTSWYRNGSISSVQETYTGGKLNGPLTDYYETGEKQDVMVYDNDLPVKLTCYDKKGKIIYQTTAKDSSIMFRSYFPNGVMRMEGMLYKGKRHGKWKIYNPLGRKLKDLDYVNGLIWGPVKTYYANGATDEKYSCDSNNVYGPYTEYYKTGEVESTGSYDMDGQTGEWLTYYTNDSLQERQFFAEGHPAGRSIDYSPSGKMVSQIFYNDNGKAIRTIDYDETGKMNNDASYAYGSADIKEYFANGKLKLVKRIRDNVLDSLQEFYFPNGQLRYQSNYIYGQANGIARRWDYQGNLVLKINYDLGEPEGKAEWFYEGKHDFTDNYINGISQDTLISYNYLGKVHRISVYKNDERHGNSDYYAPDGSLMYRLRYYEGVLVGYSYKRSDGSFVPEIPIDTNTSEITCYYPDGKKSVHISLKYGQLDGQYVSYYPSGKIMFDASYKDDDNEGPYIWYYPNGQVRVKINFHHNSRQGNYVLYYENGKKQKEGQYDSGNKEGEWYIYDETGKLTETHYYANDEMYDIRKN